MPRYRALIEYNGAAYYGFQRQRDEQPTIQGELEHALRQITGESVTVIGAGRTDSGVHALGQVISFVMEWRHGTAVLQRAINATLPNDIVVLQCEEVEPTFHPRFQARKRAYLYRIYHSAVRSPMYHHQSWFVSQPLDVIKMNQAAQHLIGVKDLATFGRPPQGENAVREVFEAKWQQEKPFLTFKIEANAFLYRMVRTIVGSLKLVGDGTWSIEEFVSALEAHDRSRAGTVAPPQGLYLVSVTYDE